MQDLAKRLPEEDVGQLAIANKAYGPTLVRDRDEHDQSPHKDLQAHLAAHLARPEETMPDRHSLGGTEAKLVVNTNRPRIAPDEAKALGVDPSPPAAPGHRFILKGYHNYHALASTEYPLTGWAEMTNQALWHAGQMGQHHQQVHVTYVNHRGRPEPFVAIKIEPHTQELGSATDLAEEWRGHSEHRAVAHKMALLDFVAGQSDRHDENCMVSPKGLLAIDHGGAFTYAQGWGKFPTSPKQQYLGSALAAVGGKTPEKDPGVSEHVMDWWKQVSPQVRQTFEQRLKLVKHAGLRKHLRANFTQRADHLDHYAAAGDHDNFWNMSVHPIQTPEMPTRRGDKAWMAAQAGEYPPATPQVGHTQLTKPKTLA